VREHELLLLTGEQVRAMLAGREPDVIATVAQAYETFGRGAQSLPHSSFLRFPDDASNRIIALPAYLGAPFEVAGLKWIASFPANLERGLDRASATLVLNSTQSGRPIAMMEASTISAARTAASAALAAQRLHRDPAGATSATLIGCGLINHEIARYLLAVFPVLRLFVLHDTVPARAARLGKALCALRPGVAWELAHDLGDALRRCGLVSFATTSARPYVDDPGAFVPGATVLHVSLRDLAPEVIFASTNVVDDPDHVCRAETSLHLAEKRRGDRGFIRAALHELLGAPAPPPVRHDARDVVVFSPFGLGVLDVAVGKRLYDEARASGLGTVIDSFFPGPWAPADGAPSAGTSELTRIEP